MASALQRLRQNHRQNHRQNQEVDLLYVSILCRDAVMLSGPGLVDNLERRQELLDHFRDALGLEMEGAGLYVAAYDLGIEWVVIKAVSDFGDGSKPATENWQLFASVMAASVVHNMFKYICVIEQWPHYTSAASSCSHHHNST